MTGGWWKLRLFARLSAEHVRVRRENVVLKRRLDEAKASLDRCVAGWNRTGEDRDELLDRATVLELDLDDARDEINRLLDFIHAFDIEAKP